MSRFIVWSALVALIPLIACDAGDAAAPVTEVIDSAGVKLVLNHLPSALGTGGLSLGAQAMLEIGAVEGDSRYQLFGVMGAHRLADGRIVVANEGSSEVRVYGADGQYQTAWGREGGGPGEFQDMTLVGAEGSDTIVVLDNRNRRISYLHPDDGFVRTVPLHADVHGFVRGVFENGAVVVGGGLGQLVTPGQAMQSGMRRPPTRFYSIAQDGSLLTDFGEYPGIQMHIQFSEGTLAAVSVSPFQRTTEAGVSTNRLYLGSQDTYEIQVFDPSGTLRSIIRLDQEPRLVTPADEAAYVAAQLEGIDDPTRVAARRSRIAEMGLPDAMPAHGDLLTDALGNLWVNEFRGPADAESSYTVFDADGALVGRITLPDRFEMIEVGSDYVLGTYTDDLDVEYLRVYRLDRDE